MNRPYGVFASKAGAVEKELKDVASFGMTPVGSVGSRLYRDPEDGSLNRFDRTEGMLVEVDNEAEEYLTLAYESWMHKQGFGLQDAEEVLFQKDLTDTQRSWLMRFVAFWDEVVRL